MGITGIYRSAMWGQYGWWADDTINIPYHPTVTAVASICFKSSDGFGSFGIIGWGVFDEQTQNVIPKDPGGIRAVKKIHNCAYVTFRIYTSDDCILRGSGLVFVYD